MFFFYIYIYVKNIYLSPVHKISAAVTNMYDKA